MKMTHAMIGMLQHRNTMLRLVQEFTFNNLVEWMRDEKSDF